MSAESIEEYPLAGLVKRLCNTTLLLPIYRNDLFSFVAPGGVGAEVGVATGGFARTIFTGAAPSKMHLVDLWETQSLEEYPEDGFNQNSEFHNRNYHSTKGFFHSELAQGKVQIHRGNSVERAADFEDNYFDWIHIDANHTCEGAFRDLIAYAPKVKPEGLIFCHDYTNNDVAKQCNFGVVEAVKEFCITTNCQPIAITALDDFPTIVLTRVPDADPALHFLASLLYRLSGVVEIRDFLKRDYQHLNFSFPGGRNSFMISI